jgi:hypothetical protein
MDRIQGLSSHTDGVATSAAGLTIATGSLGAVQCPLGNEPMTARPVHRSTKKYEKVDHRATARTTLRSNSIRPPRMRIRVAKGSLSRLR